jgi:hypothetical protein
VASGGGRGREKGSSLNGQRVRFIRISRNINGPARILRDEIPERSQLAKLADKSDLFSYIIILSLDQESISAG